MELSPCPLTMHGDDNDGNIKYGLKNSQRTFYGRFEHRSLISPQKSQAKSSSGFLLISAFQIPHPRLLGESFPRVNTFLQCH